MMASKSALIYALGSAEAPALRLLVSVTDVAADVFSFLMHLFLSVLMSGLCVFLSRLLP